MKKPRTRSLEYRQRRKARHARRFMVMQQRALMLFDVALGEEP